MAENKVRKGGEADAKHEFGRCEKHSRRWAVVRLQGHTLCMPCFETNLALMGSAIRGAFSGLGASPGSVSITIEKGA